MLGRQLSMTDTQRIRLDLTENEFGMGEFLAIAGFNRLTLISLSSCLMKRMSCLQLLLIGRRHLSNPSMTVPVDISNHICRNR